MIEIERTRTESPRPRICVIGVGGGGANAIETMIASGLAGVDFVVANTDAQALNRSTADRRIQLGRRATEGLGAGSDPTVGMSGAQEASEELGEVLEGVHMCFIAAGMGGGTGTGAASVIAATARARGILTVGVVTLPFSFEGRRRGRVAETGVAELEKLVDTLIIIPNQNLFRITGPETTFKEAFKLADAVLQQGVRGITDLIVTPGLVNLDFADIRSIMGGMGRAMMASGEASGPNRAIEAANIAIFNPLLDGEMKGARGLIISISGGDDLRLMEIDEAAGHIRDMADPEAEIIWGSAVDAALDGRIRISIVATGLRAGPGSQEAAADLLSQMPARSDQPRVQLNSCNAVQAVDSISETPFLPAKAGPTDEVRACTDDLLGMFLPEQPLPLTAGIAASDLPAVGPPTGMGLFQRMALLVRAGARAEIDATPALPEPELAGSAFYNRRVGAGRA